MGGWTAMVLTGGASRRLGSDKATTVVAGRRMIDRVLDTLPAEVPVVVVGPDPGVDRAVRITREEPPGSGPAAAVAAGLAHVETDAVAVLAVDMPFGVRVALELLPRLRHDAVIARVDGRDQPLCGVYATRALRTVRVRPGMSMREVLAQLEVDRVPVPPSLVADIDTPAQLLEAAHLLTIMGPGGPRMQEWIDEVAKALGIEDGVDVDLVLDVARDAAHGVARPAAPVTTYLLGAAVARGADPHRAAAIIRELADQWRPDTDA